MTQLCNLTASTAWLATELTPADWLQGTDLFPEKLLQHYCLLPGVAQRMGTLGGLQGTSAPRLGVQDSAIIACYQVITLPIHLRVPRHVPAVASHNLIMLLRSKAGHHVQRVRPGIT